MEMDRYLRIVSWLLGAALLWLAFSAVEAGPIYDQRILESYSAREWNFGRRHYELPWRFNPGHQDTQTIEHVTQSVSESKPADYHQQPPHNHSCPSHPLSFLGAFSRGHRHDCLCSQRAGHYLDGRYLGSGPRWIPPGYESSYSTMPGLFDSYGGRGSISLSSYSSTPFGYSKNFFRPSPPTDTFYLNGLYPYPSSIPLGMWWGCQCYSTSKTVVCMNKLQDDRIPLCVHSIRALFIQSQELVWLSADAFRDISHVQYINITNTMLRLLPRNLFSYTQNLKHLVVENNPELRYLDSDVFRGAINLEHVILRYNIISSLGQDVFTHLTNLRRLNLAYNKIRSLHEEIFRNNQELQELDQSGNPLSISSDTARDLLRNNAKLRVLLMRGCKLEKLPTDLLRHTSSLEWLDLSQNEIKKFRLEFIQDCTKLAYLGLAYNKLEVLGSHVLEQWGGSLATLQMEGNPWRCDCELLPLAGWTMLRKDAVPTQPVCNSSNYTEKKPLQHWFFSEDVMKCSRAASSLRTDLNRVLSVARAIAKEGPKFFANLLRISDDEVNFTATRYFVYAMAARTNADVHSVVWHWARFLEKVLDRRHVRQGASVYSDRLALYNHKMSGEYLFGFHFHFGGDPLATTTTKPPAVRHIWFPMRPKGFEPLVNFTYIMKNLPENLTEVVDDRIEEEVKILFGVSNGTNADSLNTAPDDSTTQNSTGVKHLNTQEQTASGLCSELREVLATLLLSIDRAKWDMAEQDFIKEEEKKAQEPPQSEKPIFPVYTWRVIQSAGTRTLVQLRLTAVVAFLTLLPHFLS